MSQWTRYLLDCSLAGHATAWDQLLTQLDYANPLLQSNFVDCLLKHFGNGEETLFVLADESGTQAMAILKPGNFGVWTTFLPSQAPVGPILAREISVFQTIFCCLPIWVIQIDLLNIDPSFGGKSKTGFALHSAIDSALTISIEFSGEIDRYFSDRSKNLIKNNRRYENRVARSGKVSTFKIFDQPKSISEALERYCVLESAGWKGLEGTALAVGNKQHYFYEELLSRYAAVGCAFVFEFWLDEVLVASLFCVQHDSVLVILKTTYQESASSFSPSWLQLSDLVKRQFERNPKMRIEFYTNASENQLAWATESRWISHHSFFRNAQIRTLREALKAAFGVATKLRSPSARLESLHVESYSRISELPGSVREVMFSAEKSSIEQGPDWYDNLIKTVFMNDPGVRFYALFHDDRVLAVLPIRIVKNRIGKTVEALGNFYTSLYQPYISSLTSVDHLTFMLRSIVTENGNVTCLLFSPMDVVGHPYRLLSQALSKAGFPNFSYHCFGNWYLNAGMNWQDYLKTRTGAMRSNIKRAKKRFFDDGGELEFVQEGPLLEAAIQDFQVVYKNSWKNEEPFPNFIPDLIRLLSNKSSLRLCIARFNGEPIGGQLWIVANEKASIFKVAYHEDFKRYSIGYLIGGMLTEHVLDVDKVKEIDFLIGDDPYKATWMSDRRERWGMVAYNPKTLKGLWGLGQEVMWRLLKPLFRRLPKRRGKVDD